MVRKTKQNSLMVSCMLECFKMSTDGFYLGIEFVVGKGRPTMEWSLRLKIAVSSSKGLSYLHENCKSKIIFNKYWPCLLICHACIYIRRQS